MDVVKLAGYVVFSLYALTSLWLCINGMMQLHLLWHYKRKKKRDIKAGSMASLPFVTIQVPVYNEKYVISRLLHTLAALDYPKDRFEIQVLDDSTDETKSLIDQHVQVLKQQGVDASVVRRADRRHYKAGALQNGLSNCKGDFIAIFDADFQPAADFLKRLLPHFHDQQVGLVQARWTHLNRDQNYLTRIQTYLLDTHFSVEQTGRSQAGYFINFCGTAGIWRKKCIEDAGGWDGDVLSEDLDLSYRAQLKGWKMVYDEQTEVPAELPPVMDAFKIQQFRWTKGMAQVLRKTVSEITRCRAAAGKKLHACFHLMGSLVFVALLVNGLLTIPLLHYRNAYPEFAYLSRFTIFTSFNLIALTLFYYNGTRSRGKANTKGFWQHFPIFMMVYMGLSVQNSIAVIQGLAGKSSAFVRTPKTNQMEGNDGYLQTRISWMTWMELAVFFYFLYGIAISFYLGDHFMLLFFLMISYGVGLVVYESVYPLIVQVKSKLPRLSVRLAVAEKRWKS